MKKHIITLLAVLASISATAGTVTKTYDRISPFSAVNISDAFQATLVQGDECCAKVTIDTVFEEYLDVIVIGNVLYVRLKDCDLKTKLRNLSKRKMQVTITCPALSQIYLTGTATVTSADKWVSPMEKFTLELSGAAKAEKMRIEAGELKASLSDASNAGISGNFAILGATVSGASVLYFTGDCNDVSVTLEDAAKASFIGTADSVEASCSKTSFLDAVELKADEAAVNCRGASKANVFVKDKLEVELTGASNCHYKSDNESLNVIPSVSRTSSLKRVR